MNQGQAEADRNRREPGGDPLVRCTQDDDQEHERHHDFSHEAGGGRVAPRRMLGIAIRRQASGQIESGQKNVTINLQTISPEEALEYARDVLEFFGPGAAPQRELPTPTIDAEPVESSVSHSKLGEGEGE